MKTRIITAIIGIPLVILLLAFINTYFFNIAIAAISVIAAHEVLSALKLEKIWSISIPTVLAVGLIPLFQTEQLDNLTFPVIFIFMLAVFLNAVFHYEKIHLQDLAVLFTFIFVICFSFTNFLTMRTEFPRDGIFYVILALGGAWFSDSGAYFVGIALGKHKLCPKISPKKTVEGAIGGVVICSLCFLLCGWGYSLVMLHFFDTVITVNYLLIFIVGALLAVGGQIGDLIFSILKRTYQIKDLGKILPGHGGILDRCDSVIITLPLLHLLLGFLHIIA